MKALSKSLNSIAFRIPALAVSLVLIVAVVVAVVSYRSASAGLLKQSEEKLEAITHSRTTLIQDYFNGLTLDMRVMTNNPAVMNSIRLFGSAWTEFPDAATILQARYIDANPNPPGERDKLDDAKDQSRFSNNHQNLHPYFRDLINTYGYYDLFIIDKDGTILYSVKKERDFASNLVSGPWVNTALGDVFRRAIASGKPEISDFAAYAPSGGEPAAFIAQSVINRLDEVTGVIAFRISPDQLASVMQNRAGLGTTGDAYLIGSDGKFRTSTSSGFNILDQASQTPHVTAAMAEQTGVFTESFAQNGSPALAVVSDIDVPGLNWSVVVEEDMDEILLPATKLRNDLVLQLLIAGFVATIICALAARSMTKPMQRITDSMTRVAEGDYDGAVAGLGRRDEVGSMAANLKALQSALANGRDERRVALYKSAAFEGSTLANMMVDKDLNIIFANTATMALMRRIKPEMVKHWPDFDPEKLIGTCIDKFHKDPQHQRRLLADPSRLPFETDISVGDLKVSLNVMAITDDKGDYAGNILEWNDVTDIRLNDGTLAAIRANQIVAVYAANGHLLDANDSFFDGIGYEREELIGNSLPVLMKKGLVPVEAIWERCRQGETISGKFERKGRDGNVVILDGSMSPVFERSGKLFRIVEIATDVTQSEISGREAKARNEAIEAATEQVVTALRNGLSALADGDLSTLINDPFADEYEQLREDFNGTQRSLREAVSTLSENASSIRSGASEISQAADDLSRRTEGQAATLEETAAALDELTASVKSAADGANQADMAMRSAREEAEASGVVVRDAVSAMEAIQKSSDQISQIIGVIDDIAFQTNLLALNAGVEAARAGEAGRGFAVVASEVRALAQRSSEAAKEIKTLISTSSDQVDRGVGLVGRAGQALNKIVTSVTEISGLVSNIAASSKEQAIGISEINNGVNQLDQVTQQNAAMVEQSTAASHALRSEANALGEIVARFRLGADSDQAPESGRPVTQMSDHRDRVPTPAARPRRVANGGAVSAGGSSAGVWHEF